MKQEKDDNKNRDKMSAGENDDAQWCLTMFHIIRCNYFAVSCNCMYIMSFINVFVVIALVVAMFSYDIFAAGFHLNHS